MSELMNDGARAAGIRLQLLSTVSSAVVLVSLAACSQAIADDNARPTVWIELGGQLERMSGLGDAYEAPYMLVSPTPEPYIKGSPIEAQRPSRYSFGGEGKLSFQPEGSDWSLSANVRYGRSRNYRNVMQQTDIGRTKYISGTPSHPPSSFVNQPVAQFANTIVKQSQSHVVLDFMAGKDVGLGMFGRGSISTFSVGVRYAQFSSRSQVTARALPHASVYNRIPPSIQVFFPKAFVPGVMYSPQYSAVASGSRSFHGIGPSLSWEASVPMVGNRRAGEVTFDWSLNAALLFGRQKVTNTHVSVTNFRTQTAIGGFTGHSVTHPPVRNDRSRTVTVPNVGLSVAASYRIENFKATLGYRADFFFGAVDAGWDTRRTTDLTFHGPFLNFSLGLGG